MTDLAVDPAEFVAAAAQFGRVRSDANGAVSALSGALGGSSGMAGSDHAGTSWAHGYDDAAKSALKAAADAVNGASNVAGLLQATGENHAHADASSTIGGGDGSLPAGPVAAKTSAPNVPSSAGGSGGGPPGWSLVEGLVGYAWPNGHQDRLRAAQGAWSAAAAGLSAAAGPVAGAVAQVQAQRSPEVPAAVTASGQIGSHLTDLASICTDVGKSCGDYAAHLDHAHHEIISELKNLLIQTAAIEAGGAVLAFFTAGIDEIAAQAAVAARIASAAAKIRRIIEVLIEAARAVATAVGEAATRAVEVTGKLKPLEGAAAKRVEGAAVEESGAAEATAAGSGPALKDGEGVAFGLTPENALAVLRDGPEAELARLSNGGVSPQILEAYDPLAGRTVEQVEKELTVARDDGSLVWDWDGQAPGNGFDGVPSKADSIPDGHSLDRFGGERGGFMVDAGTPLGDRAMPPGVATEYHTYEGTGQRLPDDQDWEVRYGPAKSAFGQPGGGNQWAVIVGSTEHTVPVSQLLREGIIREVFK